MALILPMRDEHDRDGRPGGEREDNGAAQQKALPHAATVLTAPAGANLRGR